MFGKDHSTGTGFSWQDHKGEYLDLLYDGHKVTRYMYGYDNSTPERLHLTYKPYHHVFDETGQKLLTKGPGGKYTHHRGIFIGWNKMAVGDKRYDFWHMKGVTQRHQKILEKTAGPQKASSKTLIHWIDPDGHVVIAEERQVTVYRSDAEEILLLDFVTQLKAGKQDVILNGDPEHAGFQYRPHNAVVEGPTEVKAAYLFHKDGIDPKKDHDLPWAAMSYGLNGKRYSVQHMNHPSNPSGSVYSAYRDYGRFGAFFVKTIPAGKTLTLHYRVRVMEGHLPSRKDLAKEYKNWLSAQSVP
ncbi:MAG: PmoA family protein [Planctomycetes bacterium]|nr:PmoA family protein [Planctomycetota bacterium]